MADKINADTTTAEELMRQALAGDAKAYNALLVETVRLLRPYLSRRLKAKSEIDDVLQEILISVHRARHTYDGARPFQPWVFAIARYRLKDHLRKTYSDLLRSADNLDSADNILAFPAAEPPLTYDSIAGEINRLPGKQPHILKLLHNDGCTAKECAMRLGMSESAVKTAAHRAYKTLKKKLAV